MGSAKRAEDPRASASASLDAVFKLLRRVVAGLSDSAHRPAAAPADEPWLNGVDSRSGAWRLEWEDGHHEGSADSSRWISGRARVLHERKVHRVIPSERPQDGAISDAGLSVLVDWQSDCEQGAKYHSAVIVSFVDGSMKLHEFLANADELTRRGDVVKVTFCDTPQEDEVAVARFSLSTGERIPTKGRGER